MLSLTRAPVTTAAEAPDAPVRDGSLLPGGTFDDPVRRRLAMVGLAVMALGFGLSSGTTTVASSALALVLVTGVAVPLWLAALQPRGALLVLVAVAALLLPLAQRTSVLAGDVGTQESAHDGGVHVTRAAAEDLLAGRDPYATSYADDLPESWQEIQVVAGPPTPNPVVEHMPYLPGAFLVAVPGALVERVLGVGGDPRWVMGLLIAAALVAVARRPDPGWARAAALLAFGSAFAVAYAAWGTNDTAAAALVVLAALGARRHPGWAGVALALAISYKAPLALALVPWALWVGRTQGWAALRRWWTLPVSLAATTLPFLLWGPSDFIEDTLRFWTGTTDMPFPASGLGLAYRAPELMSGPVGGVVTLAFAAAGLALAVALVRRIDDPAVLAPATSLVLLGLLIPARTFQPNYLALVVGGLSLVWLLVPGWLDAGRVGGGDGAVATRGNPAVAR